MLSLLIILACSKPRVIPEQSKISQSSPAPAKSDTSASSAGGQTTTPPGTATPPTPVGTARRYQFSVPIEFNNMHNVTISGDSINGRGVPCIKLMNCTNIHVTKCILLNSTDVGVFIWNCSGVTIDSCYISKVASGVFAIGCSNGAINITSNEFKNMTGPYPKGACVQFSNVSGSNSSVSYNRCENISGESFPEDGISMYKSNGEAGSPIMITGNWIRGGGPSTTGSGITLGDHGGSYQVAENNIIVNSGYIGMQVAGGSNIQIINNAITSSAFAWSHLGLGCGNYSGLPSSDITVSGNKVNWTAGKLSDQLKGSLSIKKDASFQAGTVMPNGWSTNILNAQIDASILPATIITR